MSFVVFQPSKISKFFGKFTEEQVFKSCLDRNNSLKSLAFGFCYSVSYDLEESIEFRALISSVLGL